MKQHVRSLRALSPRPCIRHITCAHSNAPSCSSKLRPINSSNARRLFRSSARTQLVRDLDDPSTPEDTISPATNFNFPSIESSSRMPGQPLISAAAQLRSPTDFHKAKEKRWVYPKPDGPSEIRLLPSFNCTSCTKRFVRQESLDAHVSQTHAEGSMHCTHCDKYFTLLKSYKRHMFRHTEEYAQKGVECPVCEVTFPDENQLAAHIAGVPNNHSAAESLRTSEFSKDDLHSKEMFCAHSPILGPYIEHATTEALRHEITQTQFLQADTLETGEEFIGALSDPLAPKCAYFLMSAERDLSPPIVSRFPLNAEYDELCGKLLVNFDDFFDAEECKLFCCGLTTPQRSQGFKSNTVRAVILIARRSEWAEASKYGTEMDTHANTLMFRDRESGKWHMATQSEGGAALDIVVAVMNGISLKNVHHHWKEVARVNCEMSKVYCPLCEFQLAGGIAYINEHIATAHEGHRFHCSECSKTYNSRRYLDEHVRYNHEGDSITCKDCGKTFTSTSGLNSHRRNEHKERPVPTCKECGKKFTSPSARKMHERIFHEGFRYKCGQCDMTFTNSNSYRVHVQSAHQGKSFKCPKCDLEFLWKHSLRRHIQIKHDGKRHKCPKCEKEFSFYERLQSHIRVQHDGILYKCTHCPYEHGTNYFVNAHRTTFHGGFLFACHMCDFSTDEISKLRWHHRKHKKDAEALALAAAAATFEDQEPRDEEQRMLM